jgi:adenylate kinase family enzyme
MVADVETFQKLTDTHRRGGRVIEIVGVAGSGKTTLFKEIRKRNYPAFICDYHPDVWKLSSYPFYISNIIQLLPTFFHLLINREGFLHRREIAFMAVLNGWNTYLGHLINKTNKTFIVDQGAIFLISYLRVWGSKCLFRPNMQGWWDQIYRNWSKTINLVILLDASDDVLLARINNRSQDHILKGESDQISRDWIIKYRNLYNEILNQFASHSKGFSVLRINSGTSSIDEIINQIIPRLSVNEIGSE